MNVFDTHARIIGDYASYIRSFINIADPQIRETVNTAIREGKLWPEPLLQFNPAYEMAGGVTELARTGVLHGAITDIFRGYSLYRHQLEAIQLGAAGQDFIVTSGTGSGKSLTYIGSIFHRVLTEPQSRGTTAIVVYPMNALINSQTNEFGIYRDNYENATGSTFPITFGQYTGQEKEDARQRMREDPPQVLLTNYMMLELLLTRVQERPIRDAIYENMRFLVFDELHTYRGRQGADVAMLIRRIRAQCKQHVTCIGTSATMVSVGSLASQREEVARVATLMFGRRFRPEQVVTETLARSLAHPGEFPSRAALSMAVSGAIDPRQDEAALRSHPVAVWLENRVAIEEREGALVRRRPLRINEVVSALAEDSGQSEEACRQCLADLLLWISTINQRLRSTGSRYTILPFKLHQFIAQTGSVYTTLDQDDSRFITLEPGIYKQDDENKKPIFPNVFSRATGHPFICVSRVGNRLEPREFRESSELDEDNAATDGYLIVGEEVWDPANDLEYLPEAWLRTTRKGRAPDSKKAARFPRKIYFDEYGNCSDTEPKRFWGWLMQAPLLFDPTGGVFFDTKTNEGTKLTKLGSEGRSTSTTITAFSILNRLHDAGYPARDQKLLSFTDNVQDAALQAGHFNDFVQVVQLRAGIRKALAAAPGNTLTYATIGEAVFKALALPFLDFGNRDQEPVLATVRRDYEQTLQAFLFYRAVADLRRSWRIVLPNLEQCGLLVVDYLHLDDIVAEDGFWEDMPLVCDLAHGDRHDFLSTILDFFRLEYALHSENFLTPSRLKENEKDFRERLRAPWTLDRTEDLREPCVIRLDPLHRSARLASKSMGPASALGKYVKHVVKQNELDIDLRGDRYRDFIMHQMRKLKEADYLFEQSARSEKNVEVPVFRLRIEKVLWKLGDGETVKADVIKRRSYKDQKPKANECFRNMYRRELSPSKRLRAEDHTGHVKTEDRREREDQFRADWFLDEAKTEPDEARIRGESISALFCSPTMELGIDIGGLSVGSDEYKKHKRHQDQANRQLNLLRNDLGGASELSEFYPYRYLASEGFLPGYNFTRLPLRIFVPSGPTTGEFISRPRSIALREFGPLNIIYHNGRKYRVSQLVVQDAESSLTDAKISTQAGYYLAGEQKDLEICPFSGGNLSDNANKEHLHDLLDMSESRAEEVDRISCEEEERVSRGFDVQTYFAIDGGHLERVRKAVVRSSETSLLNLRYIPASRLVHVNSQWRAQKTEGFPIGLTSGDWRSSMPEPDETLREDFRLVKLWTSNLADALYLEPIQALGLSSEGVITLQHALKRAIEVVFQVEPNEIGVVTVGDPKTPNILLYEAAEEGSLGILSQFVEDVETFRKAIEAARQICRFDDPEYRAPASYDDLLSYYNQRDHKRIDRFLIRDSLDKLALSTMEIQTNTGFRDYDEQYQAMLRGLDPNSSTERMFIQYLYDNGLRLPDAAQKRVEGIYCRPDFYYEPRFWVFCDGSPHDDLLIKKRDESQRQLIIARGDEVWVWHYREDLATKVAQRPDIFRKVR